MELQDKPLPQEFFQHEISCPVCQNKFTQLKLKKSACPVEGRDSDFCVRYSGMDPNRYAVWVCPHCGYAASDAGFAAVRPAEVELLKQALTGRPVPVLNGERDSAAAVQAVSQALFCAISKKTKSGGIAGLYLRMAWLYRIQGDPAKERAYLEKALENYVEAYQKEPLPLGKMSALTLTYLIGELFRRLGKYKEAVQYFSLVVSNKSGTEPNTVSLARDQWHLTRDQASGTAEPSPTAVTPPADIPPGGAPSSRRIVAVSANLYPEHLQWLKRSAVSAGVALDPWAVLRSLLNLALDLDPGAVEGSGEEEITRNLQKLLAAGSAPRRSGSQSFPEG